MSCVRMFFSVALAFPAFCLVTAPPVVADEARAAHPGGPPATAPDPHAAQLDAATIDAREALRQEILAAPLAPGLDVRHFLDHAAGGSTAGTPGGDELSQALQNARQRGGPRWTTDDTCEVRLEASGSDLVPPLRKIVNDHPSRLPAAREAIEQGLKDLEGQTFSALGKSTGSGNLVRLRPAPWAMAWRNVNDADRREAVMTARNNAVARAVESLRPVPTGDGKTLDDALNVPEVSGEVRDWLRDRPVTDVVFGSDLEVRLTLSAPPQELWPVVESSLRRHHLGPPPQDAKAWAAVRDALVRDMAPAVGRAVVTSRPPANAAANPAVPADPPPWVAQQVTAASTAHADRVGLLKANHDAQTEALHRVRAQVNALTLDGKMTLGEAAKSDPRIARALDAAMRRATVSKVDYLPKGVVKVSVSLDLQDVWDALNAGR